ncbi:hypothetical protein BN946_scf184943.g39 [Trametes cinnabarina]|uniref:SMP domain-containing protein n=1 Tax=Pycnoporus cinnabarinus TaxID=5643 RepID=A0A060SIF0_PYCCI|nr:hypothetical protein BN946_scf184943.g39 [Trametes cinnabarina]
MPAKGSRGGAASGAKASSAETSRVQTSQAKAGKDAAKDALPSRTGGAATRNASGSPPKAGAKTPKA